MPRHDHRAQLESVTDMRGLNRIAGYTGFAVLGALLVTIAVQLQRPGMSESPVAKSSASAVPIVHQVLSQPALVVADFPYVFAGKARAADGSPLVLLARDSQLLTLAVGGVVDGAWRVEAITDDAIDLTAVASGKHRHLGFSELTRQGETVLPQTGSGGGAALREIVVDAHDTARLQALAANPPAGALIRIVGADPMVKPTAPPMRGDVASAPVLQLDNSPSPPGPGARPAR